MKKSEKMVEIVLYKPEYKNDIFSPQQRVDRDLLQN